MKVKKIELKQTTFWPEYTHEERLRMLQQEIEKAKKMLTGLFKRVGEIKEDVEFHEGILEDLAMDSISMGFK